MFCCETLNFTRQLTLINLLSETQESDNPLAQPGVSLAQLHWQCQPQCLVPGRHQQLSTTVLNALSKLYGQQADKGRMLLNPTLSAHVLCSLCVYSASHWLCMHQISFHSFSQV